MLTKPGRQTKRALVTVKYSIYIFIYFCLDQNSSSHTFKFRDPFEQYVSTSGMSLTEGMLIKKIFTSRVCTALALVIPV